MADAAVGHLSISHYPQPLQERCYSHVMIITVGALCISLVLYLFYVLLAYCVLSINYFMVCILSNLRRHRLERNALSDLMYLANKSDSDVTPKLAFTCPCVSRRARWDRRKYKFPMGIKVSVFYW